MAMLLNYWRSHEVELAVAVSVSAVCISHSRLAMDLIKPKFYSVLSELQEKKSNNASGLMKKCEYEEIVERMKELEKSEVKKTQKDYRLLRKYDILEISV